MRLVATDIFLNTQKDLSFATYVWKPVLTFTFKIPFTFVKEPINHESKFPFLISDHQLDFTVISFFMII